MADPGERTRGRATPGRAPDRARVDAMKLAYARSLHDVLGRFPEVATANDRYLALSYAVRQLLLHRGMATGETYYRKRSRTVCYLSAEFLLGPHLGNVLLCLGIEPEVRRAMEELGEDLDALVEHEPEPGLGNGGLGRLAACYMDSLATLQIPAIGYGIRYEFGIFSQAIRDGWQVETTDKWLARGNPWELHRPEIAFDVKLGGHTEATRDANGRYRVRWIPERVVRGVAYDTYVPGYGVQTANLLRLWSAEACESFDLQAFNHGDYWRAVEDKVASENLTKVLYPSDESLQGKRLRLEQQAFFVSCSLQDMVRITLQTGRDLRRFHEKYAVQLNDTHPAIAVPELVRILVDEQDMDWEPAWEIARRTFGYTNHTLLPEALERWPVSMFGALLPRHLQIVLEVNRRFLDDVRARRPGDEELVRRVSLVDEEGERSIRMAHLACVGSHSVNGVARLHSRLLREELLKDFASLSPEKFGNVTNGVTPRRFLALVNPRLAALATEAVGEGWLSDLGRLRGLERFADDAGFREEWRAVKEANKGVLAARIAARTLVSVDPASLFDVQAKRIHEYKRQHLNLLHLVALHRRLRKEPGLDLPARTAIFGGKAAPGYRMAKLIVKLVHSVAEVVNADPATRDRLRVAFVPDWSVKESRFVFPAAELSEQISTAGKEASGTGNMKFAMNGAVTIGTLDGANVEIREEVGAENFFLFGLRAEEVERVLREGYRPEERARADPELDEALLALGSGEYSRGDRELFRPLLDSLLHHDPFLVLADFRAYVDCQDEAARAYRDRERWTRMSILNVARSGRFSSDRAVAEYCRDVWRISPEPVDLGGTEPPG